MDGTIWQVMSWLAFASCIVAYFYNIRKNKMCFVLWQGAAITFILVNVYGTHDLAQASLNFVYIFFNAYGWYKWRKDDIMKAGRSFNDPNIQ